MLHLQSNRGVRTCDGLTRREFLQAGGLAVGFGLTELARLQQAGAAPRCSEKACIQLMLVGGPSQLDTFDPKPEAPVEIRGPFRPIRTNVAGIKLCEHFPRLAQRADRFALVRSVFHEEAPIHETGHQLLQTGRLNRGNVEWPHLGSVLGHLRPSPARLPSWAMVPGPIGHTGVNVGHGQTVGFLGSHVWVCDPETVHGLDPARPTRPHALVNAIDEAERALDQLPDGGLDTANRTILFSSQAKQALDLEAEPAVVRERYGLNTFGQSCLLARRLVQHGVRLVTVNMFDTVFGRTTWDCHANGGELNSTLEDYATILCPMLDMACSALLDDLAACGLLDHTLVVAIGEFGRTPWLNNRGGRDHWPGVWSGLLAGGGIQGGQVLGASDRFAEAPKERPIHAAEIAATIYHALDIAPEATLTTPDGLQTRLTEARPLLELF